jgi:hypothetical protein
MEHHFHELMLNQQSGGEAHAQLALELQLRAVVLGLRHEMYVQEPLGQRQLAELADGAAEQAGLD